MASLAQPNEIVLAVEDLSLRYGPVPTLQDVTLSVSRGGITGIVGESGSGKSTLARSILGLLPGSAKITDGQILFGGEDLLKLPPERLRQIRGQRITYVSQDPLRALTPTLTIGQQMTDVLYRSGLSSEEKRQKAIASLDRVNMPDAARRLEMYPHELSGGQRQRVSIAMAVMMAPDLLIADEATTALDATLEQEVIKLLKELQQEIGCSMLFVTHHLGVVSSLCDDAVVLRHGTVCERGSVTSVFGRPQHDYTKMLLRSDPARIAQKTRRLPTTSDKIGAPIVIECGAPDRIKDDGNFILDISALKVTFTKPFSPGRLFGRENHDIEAVKGADLQIQRGETVAVVGESGSGKTTIARTVIGLQKAKSGSIRFDGRELLGLPTAAFKSVRREIAFIFQDPIGSLSPRMRICDAVVEPLRIHGLADRDDHAQAAHLLNLVGLSEDFLDRYPHELSGGQARRVAIARAIAVEPKLIIADEPTAGLDVSIQGEVLNLFAEIQDRTGVSMLLITHNLNVVRHISDRVAIMYMGNFVEVDTTEKIFEAPKNEYTCKLIAANHHPGFGTNM